ncbi:MAG: hypothetical protein ACTSYR_04705, partial [Candidatus Odinarchaeia archaeon]
IYASSYLLVSFGMLGLPQNVAYALIPSVILFFTYGGVKRILGLFLLIGVFIIHSPSALLIILALGFYGLFYILKNRHQIYLKETKIILILIVCFSLLVSVLLLTIFTQVLDYFDWFAENIDKYTTPGNPGLINYLIYSCGLITLTLSIIGGVYGLIKNNSLIGLFFTFFLISLILSILPYGTLGIPWPPLRYLMYVSTSASILGSYGLVEGVKIIKEYDFLNVRKYFIPIFIIGVLLFQVIIGVTAFISTGGWEKRINEDEYNALVWVDENYGFQYSVLVYPSILTPASGLLSPRNVNTNSTHIFNETMVNVSIVLELNSSDYDLLLVDSSLNPILYNILIHNTSYSEVYVMGEIKVFLI